MPENVSVLKGFLATKGLNAKCFFNKGDIYEDDKTTKTKTLLLRVSGYRRSKRA